MRKAVYASGKLHAAGSELQLDDKLASRLVELEAAERLAEPAPQPQPAAGRKRKAKEEAQPEPEAEVA
ncbi:hypothetical protein phiFa_59 [Thermus phage phiFa]|nr:hypothetical protein phiFa_59 [Thermus phage phiFa]